MRNLMIIATIAVLAASAPAWQPVLEYIPVVMDIVPVASIEIFPGTQIKLDRRPGTMDWEGSTLTPDHPVLTCNVDVTVDAITVPELPSVSSDWYTAFFMGGWSAANAAATISVTPDATPLPLVIRVLATSVDMSLRPEGFNARVATTTLTVAPL